MAEKKKKDLQESDAPKILVETKNGRTISKEELLDEFVKEFMELSKRDEEFLSNIVICHLLIEHYMIEYLQATNPMIGDLKKANLEFSQLLSLIKPEHPTIGDYLEGIKCINTIRNKCAHDLKYYPHFSALKPLTKCLNKIKLQHDRKNMIDTIRKFTGNCCKGFDVAIKVIGPTH